MSKSRQTNKNKQDLTTGSLTKHLRRLSLPMMGGIFAIVSVNVIDTYFISLLGTDQLAAVSFSFPVTFATLSFILGLGVAMSSIISRAIGQGDISHARRLLFHGLVCGFLFSLLISFIGIWGQEWLFSKMQADKNIMPYILEYTSIWFMGIALVALPIIGNAAMRGAGDSLSPSIIMMAIAIANLILDPLLIFGLLGLPALGIQGAATATVISYAAGMFGGFLVLIRYKKLLTAQDLNLNGFKESVRQLLHIGLPAGLSNMMQPLSNAIIVALLAYFSTQAVAGYGVATRIQSFVLVPIMALSTGLAAITGQNWGKKSFTRVDQALRLALSVNIGWGVFVAIILALFAQPVATLFSKEPEVIKMTVLYLTIMPITFIGAQSVQLWSSSFNACGYPKRAFLVLNSKIFVFFLPFAFLGGWFYNIPGVIMGMALGNVVAGVAIHFLNRHFFLHEEARAKTRAG